jgi:hypothetical protein
VSKWDPGDEKLGLTGILSRVWVDILFCVFCLIAEYIEALFGYLQCGCCEIHIGLLVKL